MYSSVLCRRGDSYDATGVKHGVASPTGSLYSYAILERASRELDRL